MSDEVPRPSVPLSLKARENASRNLKRIFDQINTSVREQQPSALPSLLNFLPSMDGSVGTSKFSAKDSPDCSKQPSHVPGSCQETSDFLSLHSYDADSYVEKEAFSEGSTKASPQRSVDTNLSSRPSTCALWKVEPKDSSSFGSKGRENLSVQNGISNSSDPRRVDRVNSNQQDQELSIDQFKEGAAFAFHKAAFVQEAGNRRSFRSASPVSSFMDHQQGDSTFHPEWWGNGLLGTAQAASRSSSTSGAARKQPTAQMTIFYSGVVNVYDNVPAEKANAIMLLAGSGNPWSSCLNGAPSMAVVSSATATPLATSAAKIVVPVTRESIAPFTASMATSTSTPLSTFPAPMKQVVQRSHAELPFARKVSLARFFERRKERVQAKAIANSVETAGVNEEISCVPGPQAKRFCTRSSSPSPSGNSR